MTSSAKAVKQAIEETFDIEKQVLPKNKYQIEKELDSLIEELKTLNMNKEPPGITKLYKAIDVSKKMHEGEFTYAEACEMLENTEDEYGMFQWKPFSQKQLLPIDWALNGSPNRYTLLEGAVRSGKTIASNVAWLLFVIKSKYPRHLLTGKTRDTMFRNVLSDIFEILGEGYYSFDRSQGILRFMGKTVWCLGASDERSESRFRGQTVGSWYGDEVTTYPQSVVQMAVSRPSVDGAKIFWTTNPDSPYHYIHEDYMQNEELLKEDAIRVLHFTLDDNLTLDPIYVRDLKASYSGIWYDRFIEGLWTIAEGAIYEMWNEPLMTFSPWMQPYPIYDDYAVGVDYGTSSVCCFTLMGIKRVGKVNHYHFLDEWYWDAKVKRRQKEDSEYVAAMDKFIGNLPYKRIYMPHDATSLTIALRRKKFKVSTLSPDVFTELKQIGSLIRNGQVMVSKKCQHMLRQFSTYVWDQKATEAGLDMPLKVNDHAMDAMRYNIIGYMTKSGIGMNTNLIRGGKRRN